MTTERDDEVSRRYHALAREEPPAAIDAVILAASRRAAGARPGGLKRWGPPLSIAAMLVLATGVVVRMQAEKPGLETAVPPPPVVEQPITHAPSPAEAPAQEQSGVAPVVPRRNAVAKARKESPATLPERMPAPAAPAAAAAPPDVKELREHANRAEKAHAERLMVAPSYQAAPPAARSGAAADAVTAKFIAPKEPAEAILERIALLREAGRDPEADSALEAFRRTHPDYVIADAMWLRVKPRTP